ncbi:hypothetical protein P152DRAFT_504298 [Eremomyces bilateralis CBS 781.70]|uniref:26S proteasome complex subunit SEM1 n=1 Tax=Eremomyces bilateralis CBS 781.70 TaxID=1392243 RepID=A0A6G1GFD8_9PEZI|nr:uncharacterized protein P152DRAFT_504298 [Eremomyces bilateralis CBS 781.70]KAF1816788.1 hypothetical protein P152DRAFT_504298 [Eremomyces bilateralis CBS 781.70]
MAPPSEKPTEAPTKDPKPGAASLEEDDEFEDFPVEDWTEEDTELPGENQQHLWEESWDDDGATDDFAAQLKEELKKVEPTKR